MYLPIAYYTHIVPGLPRAVHAPRGSFVAPQAAGQKWRGKGEEPIYLGWDDVLQGLFLFCFVQDETLLSCAALYKLPADHMWP